MGTKREARQYIKNPTCSHFQTLPCSLKALLSRMSFESTLFTSIKVGDLDLAHRVVFAPLTRFRANPEDRTATDLFVEYYSQRAHTPGTLLITESVFVAPPLAGYPVMPGFWTEAHLQSWKKVIFH